MTRADFLRELDSLLSQLPAEERDRQREYFDEMINDMMEEGISEDEAVSRLGDVREAADRILMETPLPLLMRSSVRPRNGWSGLSIALIILGFPVWCPLLFAFFAVALSVYVVIWSLIVALFAIVAALGISGIAVLIAIWFMAPGGIAIMLMFFGGGLVLTGLAVLAFLGTLYAVRGLSDLTVRFARYIKSLFIRKEAI